MKKFAAAAKAPSVVFSSVSTEVQIGHVLSTYVPKHRSSTSKSPKTIRDSDSWWTRIVTEMGEVLQIYMRKMQIWVYQSGEHLQGFNVGL